MKTEIKIDNLKCHGCANTITNSLQKLDGVDMVAVDVENSTVLLEHKPEFDKSHLTTKLSQLGYPEQGTTTAIQKAKSYVSCAIGRF